MLKIQIVLIAILIACVAFVSCDRTQNALKPADIIAADDMMVTDDMMDMMMDMMTDMTAHKSWAHVLLPVPGALGAAASPAETGEVHGKGSRTVYINAIGVMANKGGTEYPAGTVVVKEIMDDANTFVAKVATMMKTDDPMYADHGGWMYVKYARPSADGEYGMVGGGSVEGSMGCAGCHAKADNDSVFVSLPMAEMMDDDMMDDGMADDGMADDMMDDDMADDMMDDDMMDDDMADDGMADDMMDDDMADDGMADDMAGDDMGDDADDTPVPLPPAVEAAPPVDDAQ